MKYYIEFADGTLYDMPAIAEAGPAKIAGHRRDVITARVSCTYEQMKAVFNGQGWALGDREEGTAYDKSNYTVLASICDNLDGTVTIRVGRKNTVEETLTDENAALTAENKALAAENDSLNAQVDDLVVELLEGGAADVSETEETV